MTCESPRNIVVVEVEHYPYMGRYTIHFSHFFSHDQVMDIARKARGEKRIKR